MAKKNAKRLRLKRVTTSAALYTLASDAVPASQFWCLEKIAWEIDKVTSGGNTRCRLYIDTAAYKDILEEQQSPAANNLYTYAEKTYLYPGERLALDVDQAQNTTIVELTARGYYELIKE